MTLCVMMKAFKTLHLCKTTFQEFQMTKELCELIQAIFKEVLNSDIEHEKEFKVRNYVLNHLFVF